MTTKGITYFCTDSSGNVYTRYSAKHTAPRYVFASIIRPQKGIANKAGVNYTSRPQIASRVATVITTYCGWNETTKRAERVDIPAWSEVVPVRAYEGRHKAEPTT